MGEEIREIAVQAQVELKKFAKFELFDETRLRIGSEDESFKIMSKRVAFGRVHRPSFELYGVAATKLRIKETPGHVILLSKDGETAFTDVTINGEDAASRPIRTITAPGAIYHAIERDEDGTVKTIDSIFATEKPEDTRTTKHLHIADIKRNGNVWKIETKVVGSYTLTAVVPLPSPEAAATEFVGFEFFDMSGGPPLAPQGSGSGAGGSGGSKQGSKSNGSSKQGSKSNGSSSKTAIMPFRDKFIGWEIKESPSPRNRDVLTLPVHGNKARAFLDPRWTHTTANTVVKAVCALDKPAICIGSIAGDLLTVETSIPAPSKVTVTIEGDATGEWAGPRYREFTKAQMEANKQFWRRAHGEA